MKTMKIFNLMIFKINNQTKQNNIPTRVDLWSKLSADPYCFSVCFTCNFLFFSTIKKGLNSPSRSG